MESQYQHQHRALSTLDFFKFENNHYFSDRFQKRKDQNSLQRDTPC